MTSNEIDIGVDRYLSIARGTEVKIPECAWQTRLMRGANKGDEIRQRPVPCKEVSGPRVFTGVSSDKREGGLLIVKLFHFKRPENAETSDETCSPYPGPLTGWAARSAVSDGRP